MNRSILALVFVLAMLYGRYVLGIPMVLAAILASLATSLIEWRVTGAKMRF